MTVGKQIRVAREAKGITQKELADKLGVSFTLISQYERDVRNPKIETLEKIAKALHVSVGFLRGYSGMTTDEISEALDTIDADMVENLLATPLKDMSEDTFNALHWNSMTDEEREIQTRQYRIFAIEVLTRLGASHESAKALVNTFVLLNTAGQKRAVENVQDLAKIPEYQQQTPDKAREGPKTPLEGKDTVQGK